jgi:hypothetical protein
MSESTIVRISSSFRRSMYLHIPFFSSDLFMFHLKLFFVLTIRLTRKMIKT